MKIEGRKIFFAELSIVRIPIEKKISSIYIIIKSLNLKDDNFYQLLYMFKISFIESFTLFVKWFALLLEIFPWAFFDSIPYKIKLLVVSFAFFIFNLPMCGFRFLKKHWISFSPSSSISSFLYNHSNNFECSLI